MGETRRKKTEQSELFLKYVYVCKHAGCLRAFYRLGTLLRHQRLIHSPHKSIRARHLQQEDFGEC